MRYIALALTICVGSTAAPAQEGPAAVPLLGEPVPTGFAVTEPLLARLPPPDWVGPSGPGVARAVPATVSDMRRVQSTWYTRVDYFHWNERLDDADFVNEDGPLVTLGYVRRIGVERFRAELFGGDINYEGAGQFDDGSTVPLSSTTGYLGVRGEYDLVLEPEAWPNTSLFAGVGTRFWVRDLKDGIADTGHLVLGYQETWWTIYPYFGLERRRVLASGAELYAGARLGVTAVTYENVSAFDVALYPKPGLTGQFEAGLRGRRLSLAAFFETLNWAESPLVRGVLQPESHLFTVGLKAGWIF